MCGQEIMYHWNIGTMLNSAVIVIRIEIHCRQITNLQMVQIIQSIGADGEYTQYLQKRGRTKGMVSSMCYVTLFTSYPMATLAPHAYKRTWMQDA